MEVAPLLGVVGGKRGGRRGGLEGDWFLSRN